VWGLLLIAMGMLLWLQQEGVLERHEVTRHVAERAVDGDPKTRWSSTFDDDQWIQVDLGEVREVRRVRLVWEDAFARDWALEVSDDGAHWETVLREDGFEGGTEEKDVETRGRWVRVRGIERATPYGISLWELEVFGPPAEGSDALQLISQNQPTEASSVETVTLPLFASIWMTWWPLFVLAAGLPHLLVPRSDGEEIGGLITVGVGVVFLLDNLDWGIRQAAPIGLVAIGVVILLQGLRRATRKDEEPDENGTPSSGSSSSGS